MDEEKYTKPSMTSTSFVQYPPTNDQDVYNNIVSEVMGHREGVVDAMLLDDIKTLWDQYVNRARRSK
jgi:hypothetical protein